jgi:hypothetical protein
MDEPDRFVDLKFDESLEERMRLHLELMDKHALNILRADAELEYILSQAIQARFKNQISVQKVVGGSFPRLIRLAFAMDVVGQKTFESLLNLKDIRNRVAHEARPDTQIKDLLAIVLFLGKDAEEVV